MTNKKSEENQMNRRSVITSASIVGLAVWHKPVISSMILPAHAQTSCGAVNNVNILGNWRFTDQNDNTVDIEFIDDSNLIFDDATTTSPWRFSQADNTIIIMDIRIPRAPWQGAVTQEGNCLASEITINIAPTGAGTFTAPLVGTKI